MEPRDQDARHGRPDARRERRMYWRFAAMIATSTGVMFLLTYSNVSEVEHGRYSQERVYMALLMGGAMALVMLSFMVSMMYRNRTLNVVVVITAVIVAGSAYYASRSQLFIGDERYMSAMIPHHSIAILTSERADIDDVRVRRLADGIIRTQRLEIDQMDWLLQDIEENGPATTQDEAAGRLVPDVGASGWERPGNEAAPHEDMTGRERVAAVLASLLGLVGPTQPADRHTSTG